MAITLVTGQPGHGKSLYAIWRGLQWVKEGRPVYVSGFKELDFERTGFKPLPHGFAEFDPADKDDQGRQMPKWQLLPHGSVIMLDECYDVIPQRAAGRPVPPHVDALARHRHHGYDIVLVCQMHNQIDGFVKGLVDPHIHVRRKFGWGLAVLKTWDRFQSSTDNMDTVASPKWRYPKDVFGLYTSATMHTVKKTVPKALIVLIVAALVAAICGYKAFRNVTGPASGTAAGTAPAGRDAGTGAKPADHASARDADDDLRRRDYAAWLRPRVEGQPWTAPAYDKLQPQGVPDIVCVAVDDGRCGCYTEQGTKYQVGPNVCRSIAANGVYNPFRRPLSGAQGDGKGQGKGEGKGQGLETAETPVYEPVSVPTHRPRQSGEPARPLESYVATATLRAGG